MNSNTFKSSFIFIIQIIIIIIQTTKYFHFYFLILLLDLVAVGIPTKYTRVLKIKLTVWNSIFGKIGNGKYYFFFRKNITKKFSRWLSETLIIFRYMVSTIFSLVSVNFGVLKHLNCTIINNGNLWFVSISNWILQNHHWYKYLITKTTMRTNDMRNCYLVIMWLIRSACCVPTMVLQMNVITVLQMNVI